MIFPDGRTAAISYTFDDGTVDHIKFARPMLRKHALRGTFYVISGLVGEKRRGAQWDNENGEGKTKRHLASWADLRGLMDDGHELGNHSMTHKRLWLTKSNEDRDVEIKGALALLNERFGEEPRSWAWPYMKHNPKFDRVVRDIHTGVRIIPGTHLWTERVKSSRANAWIDKAIQYGGHWCMCIHGIGTTGPKAYPESFKIHLEYAAAHQDKVWIAPVREVAAWVKEHK